MQIPALLFSNAGMFYSAPPSAFARQLHHPISRPQPGIGHQRGMLSQRTFVRIAHRVLWSAFSPRKKENVPSTQTHHPFAKHPSSCARRSVVDGAPQIQGLGGDLLTPDKIPAQRRSNEDCRVAAGMTGGCGCWILGINPRIHWCFFPLRG